MSDIAGGKAKLAIVSMSAWGAQMGLELFYSPMKNKTETRDKQRTSDQHRASIELEVNECLVQLSHRGFNESR